MKPNCANAGRAYSRREMLALAAGIGAAALLPAAGALAAADGAAPLRTRPIPRSGELLPVIGLGTAIVFDVGADAAGRAERRAVLAAMLDGGGRLIDTAPSYGSAEVVVGDLLAAMAARPRAFVATKVRGTDRASAAAEMQQSLRRFGGDKIDLMQLHNVGASASDTAAQIALLREWKERGVFRYIGVTHYQSHANERLIAAMQTEKLDFVQFNYSMAERSAEQRLLAVAADTGTAVLANLPFGRGNLFAAVRGKALPAWAAEFDAKSWGQFFLKYILAEEAVTCVIPGTDTVAYMLDNLGAGRGRLPDRATRKRMLELIG